jgi:thiol-disulfide isomerase/thioredoxin
MIRRLVAAMIAPALFACGPETPPAPAARQPPTASTPAAPEIRAEPPPLASTAPPAASSAPPPAPAKLSLTELAPTQGDLTPLLVEEAKRAKDKGLVAVVYFYAPWCAPCRVFQQNFEAPEIQGALAGVRLVKLNLDDWHDKLKGTGFAPKTIPSFYLFDAGGQPTGKMLDGDKWGKSTPSRMGEALATFLRGAAPARSP